MSEESAPKQAPTARTYVLLGILVLLLVVLFGGPLRGLLHKRALVRVSTVDAAAGPLPHAALASGAASSLAAAKNAPPTFTEPSVQTVRVGAALRRYVEIDPVATADDRARPLVLVIHGDGGSAESFHQAFPYERTSRGDAVVVYPDGLFGTWTLGGADPNEDLRFVDALVAKLVARGGIDAHRVFAVGYSSGGFLANLVACRHPGLLRAFASNAGGAPYEQKLSFPNGFPRCEGEKPTAAMILHGDQDFGVTIDSGEFSAQYWAYVNGCSEHERETTGYSECQAYRSCPQATPVVWCEIGDLGHWIWDRGAEASWQFFNALPG